MQSWSIKIDIKLNIDDLNGSRDGQIIVDMKQDFGQIIGSSLLGFHRKSNAWRNKNGPEDKDLVLDMKLCHYILGLIGASEYVKYSPLLKYHFSWQ